MACLKIVNKLSFGRLAVASKQVRGAAHKSVNIHTIIFTRATIRNQYLCNSRLSQSSNIISADIYDVIPCILTRTNVTQEPDAAGITMNMHTADISETSVIRFVWV